MRHEKHALARPDRELKKAAGIAFSLALILALQVSTCGDKLKLPLLDTRLHYNYDNADYLFRARNGNRNGDLRSQFGVTVNAYSRWGVRRGNPTYYTDHPFLVKTVFQQFTKITGTPEWAARAFYLAISFATAAGAFAIFLQATGSLMASLAGAVTLVCLPLFAVYQTCVKFETDGMLAGVWLFVALSAYFRRGTKGALAFYGVAVGLAILAHWTGALFVGAIAAYLLSASLRTDDPKAKRALTATASFGFGGVAALAALLIYLRGSWASARGALSRSFAERSAAIPAAEWWARQWTYAKSNFTPAVPWIVAALSLSLAGPWLWKRRSRARAPVSSAPPRPGLAVFFFTTLAVACIWLFAFREGSFIHLYWQYWFCLPIAALVAGFAASLGRSRSGLTGTVIGCAALAFYLLSAAKAAYAQVLDDQLGARSDIEFLSSLRNDTFSRFVFVPISETPLNQWFQGPLFEYYTDRPAVIADAARGLRTGEKLLVLRYQDRDAVVSELEEWSRKRLDNEKCGERMCAYDVSER